MNFRPPISPFAADITHWSVAIFTLLFGMTMIGCKTMTQSASEQDSTPKPLHERRLPDLPGTFGFAGGYTGVSNGALIFVGGTNFPDKPPSQGGKKVWYDNIFVLDSPDGKWVTAGKLDHPLAYGVSLTVPEGLLCVGGNDDKHAVNDVFLIQWDHKNIVTKKLADLPSPLAGAGGAVVGDTVYIAGGFNGVDPGAQPSERIFCSLQYKRPGAKWQVLESWPGDERYFPVCAAARDSIYVISGMHPTKDASGRSSIRCLADSYRYRPAADGRIGSWSRIADLPTSHAAAPSPAAGIGDRWIAIVGGGVDANDIARPAGMWYEFRKTVTAYDIPENRWQQIGTISQSRVTTPLVPWRDMFIVAGGESRSGVRSNQVWAYWW